MYGLGGGIDEGLFGGDRLPEGHLPHGAMSVNLFAGLYEILKSKVPASSQIVQ